MTLTTCHMSVSLDGFVAGPHQTSDDPIGVGGMRLHEWHLGQPLHEADAAARDLLMRPRGAYVMGRNMFGPIRGDWDADWRGWWGDDPGLEPVEAIHSPNATHIRYRVGAAGGR